MMQVVLRGGQLLTELKPELGVAGVPDRDAVAMALGFNIVLRDAAVAKAQQEWPSSVETAYRAGKAERAAQRVVALTALLDTASVPAALSSKTLHDAKSGLVKAGLVQVDLGEIEKVKTGEWPGPLLGTGVLDDLNDEAIADLTGLNNPDVAFSKLAVQLTGVAHDLKIFEAQQPQ